MLDKENIHIGVVGSRSFTDYELLKKTLEDYISLTTFCKPVIVYGGAKGTDKLAEKFAQSHGWETLIFPAKWTVDGVYNPKAGFERNVDIISNSDVVIAFWDGISRGTKHSIDLAKKMKKELIVVRF